MNYWLLFAVGLVAIYHKNLMHVRSKFTPCQNRVKWAIFAVLNSPLLEIPTDLKACGNMLNSTYKLNNHYYSGLPRYYVIICLFSCNILNVNICPFRFECVENKSCRVAFLTFKFGFQLEFKRFISSGISTNLSCKVPSWPRVLAETIIK